MLKRLRLKFIVVNMTIVTAMLCIIFGVVLHTTRANLEEESIRMMASVAIEPMGPGRPGEPGREVRLPYFMLTMGYDGKLMATGNTHYDLSDEEFLNELVDTVLESNQRLGVIEEYGLRFNFVQTPRGERLVFADITSEQSTVNNLVKSSLLIGAGSFLVFLVISILLARWAVKPVEKAWAQQRQFVADASHELKTPLTVITTNAELLNGEACGEEERRSFSGSILTMAGRMRGLTESLLELARVDNGKVKASFDYVDFSELVSDAVLPFEAVYFERGLSLAGGVEEKIQIKGSENHLRQVVDILLDNAQKYSFTGSTVEVRLKRQGRGACLLAISNFGPEIGKADLKNIFKRFYRVDQTRTHDGSFGLGLSIAEGIVSEHKGKIWAESEQGINTFFVQLPTL